MTPQERQEFEDRYRRTGQWAEFLTRFEHYWPLKRAKGLTRDEAFDELAGIFLQEDRDAAGIPEPDPELDRRTGRLTYVQCAEWAFENLDRPKVPKHEAPSLGAWNLLERARKDPSILDAPLMLAAKKRAVDDEEREIQKDCTFRETQLTQLIDRLLAEPL